MRLTQPAQLAARANEGAPGGGAVAGLLEAGFPPGAAAQRRRIRTIISRSGAAALICGAEGYWLFPPRYS